MLGLPPTHPFQGGPPIKPDKFSNPISRFRALSSAAPVPASPAPGRGDTAASSGAPPAAPAPRGSRRRPATASGYTNGCGYAASHYSTRRGPRRTPLFRIG